MRRKPKAKIITANGGIYYGPYKVAVSLLKSCLAKTVSLRPQTIEMIPLRRIKGSFIPADCREFIEEFIFSTGVRYGQHRSIRPRKAVNQDYVESQRVIKRPKFTPSPHAQGI